MAAPRRSYSLADRLGLSPLEDAVFDESMGSRVRLATADELDDLAAGSDWATSDPTLHLRGIRVG